MKIPTFLITVVGYSIAPLVESLFLAVGINPVNPPNNGQLGNFRTLTYRFEFLPDDVINTRRKFMSTVQQESTHLYAMYPHGDWMHVYVFDKKKPSGIVECAPNTRL